MSAPLAGTKDLPYISIVCHFVTAGGDGHRFQDETELMVAAEPTLLVPPTLGALDPAAPISPLPGYFSA